MELTPVIRAATNLWSSLSSSPKDSHYKLPPMLPGAVPVLGHALEMRRDPVALIQRGRDMFGDIFSMRLPGRPTVVMTGHRAQEKYFRFRDEEVDQREVYRFTVPVFGKGIAYDAEPEIMREQLGFFHAALREARLKTYAAGFVEEAEDYFGKWGDEGVVNMVDVGNELTIYTSSRSLLGKGFRTHLSAEFAHLYHDLEAGMNTLSLFAPNFPSPSHIKRDQARVKLGEMIGKIVEERRAKGSDSEDFMEALLEATYKDGRQLSAEEITGLLLTIMFAGHHTSGVTFAWTAVMLAKHPHIVADLRDEQEAVLGGRTDLGLDDLRAMHKLEWSVKEVLRMYPPLIMLMRKALKDLEFGGYDIPAGTMMMASPAVGHRIPSIFADPHRFDPYRFGPGREEDKKFPYGHIAFGAGRHRCMGVIFAQLQLRALWSHLLRNFDLELVDPPSSYVMDYTNIIAGPHPPCRLRYRRRPQAKVSRAS
ncbi:MAG: cytochrome P450 [Myxococcales bacterium]|nr:cytochrome P450 [Myxococcales bacterium]